MKINILYDFCTICKGILEITNEHQCIWCTTKRKATNAKYEEKYSCQSRKEGRWPKVACSSTIAHKTYESLKNIRKSQKCTLKLVGTLKTVKQVRKNRIKTK